MIKKIVIIALFLSAVTVAGAQQVRAGLIAFYNLENLFDTIDTPGVLDEEFTPEGPNKWSGKRYLEKLDNMAMVISRIGEDDGWSGGPAVLGVSEIENRSVLEDLAAHPLLRESNYQIVHYDSPDLRGVDVALMYRPRFFSVTASASPSVELVNDEGERIFTRDQLVVSGIYDGEPMHFIVGHWPSRSNGEAASRPRRFAAAALSRRLVDSLQATASDAKVFVMGDFNDDPVDKSLRNYLRASGRADRLREGEMYNAMFPLFRKGIGSLYYRDGLNLFDQIVVTPSLVGNDYSSYRLVNARVFNAPFLLQKDGQYKGYPLRSFVGTVWQGGYSDHFPVYVLIVREE
jgi:hypothetical protein